MYKKIPLKPEQVQELRQNPLWNDLVAKFGEDNVVNNYVVDYVILQEEKDVYAKDGTKLHISPELIRKVYNVNQSIFEKYVQAPINKMKSFMNGEEAIGHIPLITDHESLMTNKHGAIVPGSLKLLSLDGKLHLMAKAVLISPESKWGYVTGNWREVSPTILGSYKISELSYVPFPAQMSNSSLSSGEDVVVNNYDELDRRIQEAKVKAQDEKLENEVRRKEFTVHALTDKLVNKGVIPSGKRKVVESVLTQLGSGESYLVTELLQKVSGKSPFANKPRNMYLKGAIEMSTTAERYAEFQARNKGVFKSALDLNTSFQAAEAEHNKALQLASGEGQVSDPKAKYNEMFELLEKDEEMDEDVKSRFVSLACGKFGLKLSGDTAPGGQVDAGGAEHPNNTSLSDGAPVVAQAQDTLTEMLEKAYNTTKNENAALTERLSAMEQQLSNIKSSLGV